MIGKTLKYTVLVLNDFLLSESYPPVINPQDDNEPVILENIAKIEDPSFLGNNKIVLSLVNLEEESALKNRRAQVEINGNIEYRNPPVVFNIYVLFSSNITDYPLAIDGLNKVIKFFQSKNFFSYAEAPPPGDELIFTEDEQEEFRINFDLYTMTFEQLNHLWGALGGKQVPSVLYKIRVAPVDARRVISEGTAIERIRRNGRIN